MSEPSATSRMTPRFGIDTSVLVRLVAGEPPAEFERCVETLRSLIEERAGLLDVLRSGMVAPLNGRAILAALEARESAGLLDRLIAEEYSRVGLEVLTLDRRMAALPAVRRL